MDSMFPLQVSCLHNLSSDLDVQLKTNVSRSIPDMNASSGSMTSAEAAGAPPLEDASNWMLRSLDRPFETWQSTALFVVLIAAFAGVTIFLGIRYIEALRFNQRECCDALLSLEPHRPRNDGQDDGIYWGDESWGTGNTQMPAEQETDIRRRTRPRDIQLNIIEIGEVREGKIAQRRASNPRNVANLEILSAT
ncbi:hypothetical protein PV05_02375 [Exophiala xenobiotica]|uniref:Uncharacterized protein n=1 Tax=Exophiala xenobiotica TaxID=348802 RepID=A0A0D2D649_9EURO|nr:uncharacterized protein PV05_02375 [Exophiala xenobiotica]KIW57817.1 hypothetical protein PV05_02375 [Exophiala xenobiotica]